MCRGGAQIGRPCSSSSLGWIVGDASTQKPFYGVMTDDLSVPTQNWQRIQGKEPLPAIRYFTYDLAAKDCKERGNRVFRMKLNAGTEEFYDMALSCELDRTDGERNLQATVRSNLAVVRLRLGRFEAALEDA